MNNLTVVVPYRNGAKTIDRLLDSLPKDLPVIVVDDMSDPWCEIYRPTVRVLRMLERGYFAGAVNRGIVECDTDVLILNQDGYLEGDVWQSLITNWQKNKVAIAGDAVFSHPAWRKGYVQGTFMFLSRDAINKVGLLNAADYPLWGGTALWQLDACRMGLSALPVHVPGFHHDRAKGGDRFGTSITRALQDEPGKQDLFIRTPPAISVVIPCYNYGRYLPDAIHSLIGGDTSLGKFAPQTFASFEIIIVDDASTDDSLSIARSFANDWQAIRVYRNERNSGTAETINAGIRQSFGKYIAVLSADDMMDTARLYKMYRVAEQNPHSCVYDDFQVFRQGKRTDVLQMMHTYDFDKLLYKNQIGYGVIYPRRAWEEAGGYPAIFDNGREDWAFNVALGAAGYCGIHIAEPLLLYRREGHNRTLRNAGIEWRQQFVGKMQSTFPKLYEGERPKMCCGNRNNKRDLRNMRQNGKQNVVLVSGGNGRGMTQSLTGAAGMTAIEYIGHSSGTMQFIGTVSRQTYLFGGQRKIGYVANEDVDGFLDLYHNQKQLFQRAVVRTPEPVKAIEIAPIQKPDAEPVVPVMVETNPLPIETTATIETDYTPTPVEELVKPKRKYTKKAKPETDDD